jgi:DNA-binding transcriptional regulator GbsR (MarR family)
MDAATARFSDRMGQIFENEGEQRTAGRMFGFLLVSEGVVSLDHLAEALGVSKASASTNARALAQMGVLERVSRPGDRHDYYGIAPDLFTHTMTRRLQRWQRFTEAVQDARRTIPSQSPGVRARLKAYETGWTYMMAAIGQALERWNRAPHKKQVTAGGSGR